MPALVLSAARSFSLARLLSAFNLATWPAQALYVSRFGLLASRAFKALLRALTFAWPSFDKVAAHAIDSDLIILLKVVFRPRDFPSRKADLNR